MSIRSKDHTDDALVARNKARRSAAFIVERAWRRATDPEVSAQMYRVIDYLVTPESLVELSATGRKHAVEGGRKK